MVAQPTLTLPGGINELGYKEKLLKVVLASLDNPYELKFLEKKVNRKRLEVLLEQGDIDVTWFPATPDLEEKFIALKYPIYKGLASYRFLLVKNQHRNRLKNVSTIDSLKTQYVGGTGRFWSTTKVYEKSGFRLVTAVKKPGLFHMLEGGRFDYFLRGTNEVKKELETYSDLNLIIDPSVVVYMPTASYTYVNAKRPELAAALTEGYRRIIDNGEFDAYVKKSFLYKDLISISREQKRKVLRLKSDSYALPENDHELWMDLGNFMAAKQANSL